MKKKKFLYLLLLLSVIIMLPACLNQSVPEPAVLGESDEEIESISKESSVGREERDEKSGSVERAENTVKEGNAGKEDNTEEEGSIRSSEKEESEETTFSLRISQGYGASILADEKLSCQPILSVMDALYSVYPDDIETAYGGSYVKGIASLRAEVGGLGKPNKDWFFFVNGIFADTGALDYLPQRGEKLWWDYHPWQMFQATNTVIGCYPEPFLHGYRGKTNPTRILYRAEERDLASQLAEALSILGVRDVSIMEISGELIEEREGPTIVVGVWEALKQINSLDELNQGFQKNGTFVHFTDSSIELLDYTGKKGDEVFAGTGVITASGKAAGDVNPLWIISGTDIEGVRKAVTFLVKQPSKIAGYYSAVISSTDEIVRLPLMPK